jgi:hypothetical protein
LETNPNATVDLDEDAQQPDPALLGLTVTEMENVLAKAAVGIEALIDTARLVLKS